MYAKMADVRAAAPAIALGIAITGGSAPVDRAPQLWRSCAGLTDAEMSRVATGGVVAKSLPSPEHRETAVAGAIRIGVPVDFFVRRFRDIVAFKRSEMVLQIGRFSDSPTAEDLRGLTFDPADLDALRRCRVGSCGLKLSAEAIERFRTGVDWNAANWRDQAATLARRMIAEAARAYMEHGDATIRATNDKRKPIDPTAEFRALLANLGCDRNEAPRFFEYLADYPQNRPADAESFIYWSKESFGMKSVISLTHVIIHRKPPDGPVLIATKGLLSSHYLDASLGLTLLFPTGTAAAPAVDVIYINRSRADALGGLFGGITRAIVSGRQRDGTVDELRALKGRLETSWRDDRPSGTLR
ncbi:MAG TPA: hypothetical protein VH458_05260 [Vicinamibacterales bacterium]|jgi:hypothetical protein